MTQTAGPLTEHHRPWGEQQHADVFDYWRFIPTLILTGLYESFNEIRLLNEAVRVCGGEATLLEVGCATGELHRYARARWSRVRYVGCDISEPALRRARLKYPRGAFVHTQGDLHELAGLRPDIVFCRDVVHHQPDPFAFLAALYGLAGRCLVLRLRTRDHGPTERDPERSCQYVYGSWVPYIVLNCGEVVSALQTLMPAPARVKVLKHYMVLGGQHLRFLPKDCYDPTTGTAETGVLVEKGNATAPPEVVERASPDGVSGSGMEVQYFFGRAAGRIIRQMVGRGYRGATWW